MVKNLQELKLCPLANLEPCAEERCHWYDHIDEVCVTISLWCDLIEELNEMRQVFRDALREISKLV